MPSYTMLPSYFFMIIPTPRPFKMVHQPTTTTTDGPAEIPPNPPTDIPPPPPPHAPPIKVFSPMLSMTLDPLNTSDHIPSPLLSLPVNIPFAGLQPLSRMPLRSVLLAGSMPNVYRHSHVCLSARFIPPSSVTSIILVCQISARKPNHNSVQLYGLTVLIDTYYITFYITHLYR
jgi:hypothetical protein